MAYTVVAQNKEHLKKLIEQTIKEKGNYCDLNFIDVSNVTDMSGLFQSSLFQSSLFGGRVSRRIAHNLTNTRAILSQFNGDISKWDVSNVTNMHHMFKQSQFNGNISEWDVSKVTMILGLFLRIIQGL